ncbi:peptide/nickel transport system ATP-binding protein [Candidatus Pantoea symbiotica]|jgi:peptide/nickel transport system ATP-binding protein|uniref:Peptide/nickel transport system ATP-binding protein n=1 Tax=Candidatus Pantoea symbiotica TaxID=1884370 RepID=A0A1I3T1E5_9GAMM|nr:MULTISPECIES: ABC transporter ATP-binding protein [Pantoea]KAJ9432753.1 ABC transporter ATP-binding protein [Pantoea sp. YR343]SFJ64894.1 peptide/nickel transport system ATP-binding protein [Pantoea symbiotica]SFU52355.1 peptide/nickel transport system ATP-binding protein [Pantoea sp. YR525]
MSSNVIDVRGLNIWASSESGPPRHIVKNVSFALQRGQCLALVGESGSGKSVTARSLVGLAGEGLQVQAATLSLHGETLQQRSDSWWRQVRGSKVGFILQDALVSLDPLRPVGKEIAEALALHGWGNAASRQQKVQTLLEEVGVPQAAYRASQRPGELSGGLRQRALIASAIALHPDVLIADEPTTALDVTVQAQVLEVLRQMLDRGTSVILISHDLAVVAKIADQILVMQGGSIVEAGTAQQVLQQPQHAYTQGLINAIPSEHTKGQRLSGSASSVPIRSVTPSAEVLLEARHIVKRFRGHSAVDDVSFSLKRGETLGVVGESGSGKTTLSRIALALETPDSGEVLFAGQPWSHASAADQRAIRRQIAVVYQDPLSSFDPRWRVADILLDAIALDRHAPTQTPRERAISLLQSVGLGAEHLTQWPARMSGGQRQRVAIARAIATHPKVIVLDEAVSALDVTIQAQILDLLSDLQAQLGVSYLFISHDLGVIHHMSDRVLVMQNGQAVEQGAADEVFYRPRHPYTQTLLASLPRLAAPETA